MPQLQPEGHAPGRFPTTQWSRVVTAAGRDAAEAREALAGLCQAYWYPLYAYVRHRGYAPEQAQDLTQDFFAYVLERDLIAKADPARGRFRSFLRTVCARHLADRPRPGERGQAGRGRPAALHRPARRRAPLRPRARPRADRGADLRPDLGPDPAGPGRRPAPPRVRRRRPGGDVRGAARRADPRPRVRLLRGDRPAGWGRPRGPSASPSTASGAATACCSARRSRRRSATPPRSTTRSGPSSPPWRAEARRGPVTFADRFIPTKKRWPSVSDANGTGGRVAMIAAETCPDCGPACRRTRRRALPALPASPRAPPSRSIRRTHRLGDATGRRRAMRGPLRAPPGQASDRAALASCSATPAETRR